MPTAKSDSQECITMATETQPREDTHTRRIPPYHVILENDDYHSMPFVMEVLMKALGVAPERAYELMMQAHTSDRAVVWTGPLEGAELKQEQIRSFHEIRETDGAQLGPLGCTIEPAPGG
jgi:ATP-dependent Clp protease adaptor protein ClpS